MGADFKRELDFLSQTVRVAWDRFKDKTPSVRSKGAFDCVTDIDLGMEEFISAAINANFPNDVVVGEEFNPLTVLPMGRVWTIDPIDGTVNMAHSIDMYGVQCALVLDKRPVVSVIYLPMFDEFYQASVGGGAYCNGEKISVQKRPLDSSVVVLGDYSHKTERHALGQIEFVRRIFDRVGKLRHLGAASVDFAWLAAGKADGFMMYTRNLWDLCPGLILAAEAGAKICAQDGSEYKFGCEGMVAASTDELQELMVACISRESWE